MGQRAALNSMFSWVLIQVVARIEASREPSSLHVHVFVGLEYCDDAGFVGAALVLGGFEVEAEALVVLTGYAEAHLVVPPGPLGAVRLRLGVGLVVDAPAVAGVLAFVFGHAEGGRCVGVVAG